jgi:hypothetical protein
VDAASWDRRANADSQHCLPGIWFDVYVRGVLKAKPVLAVLGLFPGLAGQAVLLLANDSSRRATAGMRLLLAAFGLMVNANCTCGKPADLGAPAALSALPHLFRLPGGTACAQPDARGRPFGPFRIAALSAGGELFRVLMAPS